VKGNDPQRRISAQRSGGPPTPSTHIPEMPASSSSAQSGLKSRPAASRGKQTCREAQINIGNQYTLYTIRLIALNLPIWPNDGDSNVSSAARHTMVFHETCSLVPGTRPDDSSPPPRRARVGETSRARRVRRQSHRRGLYQIPIPRMIFSIRHGQGSRSEWMGNSKKAASPRSVPGCKIVREVGTMEIPVQHVCWREAVAAGSLSSARAGGFLRRVVHGFLAYR
jgi:hypothetical protein